ncbi:MAG: hypothetical protein ACLUDF_03015 [Butyricicoccus sp.]
MMRLWQNNPQLGGTDRIQPGQMLVLSYGNKLGRFAVNGYAYPSIDLRVLRRTLPYLTYLSVFSVGFDNAGRIYHSLPSCSCAWRAASGSLCSC